MTCVRRMTGNSSRGRIRNEDLRKRLGPEAAIDYLKRQNKFLEHAIRQREFF
jgi:hypothetical protein